MEIRAKGSYQWRPVGRSSKGVVSGGSRTPDPSMAVGRLDDAIAADD